MTINASSYFARGPRCTESQCFIVTLSRNSGTSSQSVLKRRLSLSEVLHSQKKIRSDQAQSVRSSFGNQVSLGRELFESTLVLRQRSNRLISCQVFRQGASQDSASPQVNVTSAVKEDDEEEEVAVSMFIANLPKLVSILSGSIFNTSVTHN